MAPENYSREFNGPTRMREALVKSLNLVSVRILMGTGIEAAVRHIKAFGFDDTALPRNLSLALGSGGASPWDMAAGYAVFANGGRRVEHYVLDRVYDAAGDVVYQARPRRACEICAQSQADALATGEAPATPRRSPWTRDSCARPCPSTARNPSRQASTTKYPITAAPRR